MLVNKIAVFQFHAVWPALACWSARDQCFPSHGGRAQNTRSQPRYVPLAGIKSARSAIRDCHPIGTTRDLSDVILPVREMGLKIRNCAKNCGSPGGGVPRPITLAGSVSSTGGRLPLPVPGAWPIMALNPRAFEKAPLALWERGRKRADRDPYRRLPLTLTLSGHRPKVGRERGQGLP